MTSADRTLIRTRDLLVGYRRAAAAVPDFDLSPGLVWHVTGPNGSGKTALLKTVADLLRPIAGRIERGVGRRSCRAIYVHSTPYLFAGSVRRNLSLARPAREDLESAAVTFGLSPMLDRDAAILSHGEQRRVALARAIAGRPQLLLVDEPEGGLDEESLEGWRACMVRAIEEGDTALVVATHRPVAFDGIPVREIRLSPYRA
jgi:ABC-type transport system involved in cytochrome bd biosynthesis fused ATPase/permease subunit